MTVAMRLRTGMGKQRGGDGGSGVVGGFLHGERWGVGGG